VTTTASRSESVQCSIRPQISTKVHSNTVILATRFIYYRPLYQMTNNKTCARQQTVTHNRLVYELCSMKAVPWLRRVDGPTVEGQVRAQTSRCGFCGRRSGTWTGFSPRTSGCSPSVSAQYGPYSYFIYLPSSSAASSSSVALQTPTVSPAAFFHDSIPGDYPAPSDPRLPLVFHYTIHSPMFRSPHCLKSMIILGISLLSVLCKFSAHCSFSPQS
jgi:hypothetical protein